MTYQPKQHQDDTLKLALDVPKARRKPPPQGKVQKHEDKRRKQRDRGEP
jgi:hypothetical protein